MLRNKWFITLTLIGLATVIVACSIQTTPTPESNIGTDQLAETLVAIQTLSAGATAVAELTQISQATPTSGSQQPGVPTPIIVATTTVAQPTLVVPTVAPPAPTAISVPCNWAQYITDVTFPDYSQILPGTAFTKVWRVKNIGTCAWSPGYALVFTDGFKMQGTNPQAIGVTVLPGQTADIGVKLVAPISPTGTYTSYYKLQNEQGSQFGIGDNASNPLWIKIKVTGEKKIVYDMVTDAKRAAWQNSVATITFGDTSNPNNGFATDTPAPQLENGSIENETGLVMHPNAVSNGSIQGTFPAFTIKDGDRFQSVIGCQYGYVKCNIKFTLSYRTEGGATTALASWDEINEGLVNKVDVDLSKLAGKTINLILTISTNGDPVDDYGIWLRPRVVGYR
jgi:hypothetical protein